MGDLFTYRLRLIYGEWNIIVDGVYLAYQNFFVAKQAADDLERRGYKDGDREAA